MKLMDSRGLPVSTSSHAALEKYELAVGQTLGNFGNPLATLEEALAEDADFATAHALRAAQLYGAIAIERPRARGAGRRLRGPQGDRTPRTEAPRTVSPQRRIENAAPSPGR
jgi:hypothetical protein